MQRSYSFSCWGAATCPGERGWEADSLLAAEDGCTDTWIIWFLIWLDQGCISSPPHGRSLRSGSTGLGCLDANLQSSPVFLGCVTFTFSRTSSLILPWTLCWHNYEPVPPLLFQYASVNAHSDVPAPSLGHTYIPPALPLVLDVFLQPEVQRKCDKRLW